jgi:hypothetical protein
MLVLLITASVIDGVLALLLVAISGLIFGGGPEGLNGEVSAVILWTIGFVWCLVAPVIGFWLRRAGRVKVAAIVALMPLPVALLFLTI